MSFADLENQIAVFLTGGRAVDPTTGQAWTLARLLQAASGRSTWLASTATPLAREQQIEQVAAALVWRVASLAGYGTTGESTLYRQAFAHAPDCPNGSDGYAPTSALDDTWRDLVGAALRSTTAGGGELGTVAGWSVQGGTFNGTVIAGPVASILVDRDVWRLTLSPYSPLRGFPVGAAKLIVPETQEREFGSTENQVVSVHDLQPLFAIGQAVAADRQVGLSDFKLSGTELDPVGVRQVAAGFDADFNVAPQLILQPNTAKRGPLLQPGLLLNFKMPEPPHGFPPPSTLIGSCYWGAGATLGAPTLIYRETLPPLVPVPAATHIGTVALTATDRLAHLAALLQAQVAQLSEAKQRLEDTIVSETAALAEAQTNLITSQAPVGPLSAQLARAGSFLAQIEHAEENLPSAVQAELQARESLIDKIARLQDQEVAAEQSGQSDTAGALRSSISYYQAQLSRVRRALAGHDGAVDELLLTWIDRVGALQNQLYSLRRSEGQAENAEVQANDALAASQGQRAALDAQLLDVAQQLANIDFVIDNVSVSVGGLEVFRGTVLGPYLRLDELDAAIKTAAGLVEQMNVVRQTAKSDFIAAEQRSRAALAGVSQLIWSNAKKKFAIELAYNAWDIAWATSKGGVVGAGAEFLKKLVYAVPEAVTALRGSGGATEFDADYSTGLASVISLQDKALTAGEKRIVEATLLKPARDKLNSEFGALLFKKFYPGQSLPWVASGPATPPVWQVVPRLKSEITQFVNGFNSRSLQLRNLSKGVSFKPVWFADLAGSLVKDLSKVLLKGYLDQQERAAWNDYFEKELIAQMYFPLYQGASARYWEAFDYYNSLLDEKARILEGFDPTTHSHTLLDRTFRSNAILVVTIRVTRPPGATVRLRLGVLVAGRPATQTGIYQYTISADGLQEGPSGLGLRINAS